MRLVYENSPDAMFIMQDGVFIDCNQAAVDMFRVAGKDDLLRLSLSQFSPSQQSDGASSSVKANEMIALALQRGNHRFEWLARRQDQSEFSVEILLTSVSLKEKPVVHAVWRDISRRREAERELSRSREIDDAFRAGQGRVLEMIARGAPLSEVLAILVNLIEAQSEGMLCSVLQLSEDGKHIRHGAAPNLPEIYVKAVDGAPIGPKNGSCGTAMFLGKQVIVTDMLEDPLWEDYRDLAKLSGLRACWSTPIFSGQGKVLGSFAMYYREPQAPTGAEARLTEVATHIAGVAIEHERATNELRSTEERFAKAFNANPHPMSLAMLDDGRVIEVNESFVELTGYSRPELIERGSVESLWEIQLSRSDLIEKVRRHGVVRNLEARIPTRGGASRLVLLSSLIVDIGGQPCLLSVANDVTERRQAEEQVSLLQAITMEVAVAPDLNAAIEVVLRRVCQTTGWVLGQSWIPLADGTALECSPAWFANGPALEEFRLGSEHARLPKGVGLPGRVWLSKQPAWIKDVSVDSNFPRAVLATEAGLKAALALPIVASGEVIAVIEFFMREPRSEDERLVKVISAVAAQLDLAIERKRAEERLSDTRAELAHVARLTTMGELAASIAHEVNQPLGAIVGNADICLQWLDHPEFDVAQVREALKDIAGDGHRASQVISRIRSLVKKQTPAKAAVDLSEIAREVIALVGHEAQRKQVTVHSQLSESLPAVMADRVQLQQVLLNLAMNGIEAMNEVEAGGRELVVTTEVVESGVLAAVSDSGVGIDATQAEQIFRPFHTTKSGGMGMGLAISRSI
ncbi:MAG TPA: GAF domain-containing protein, partial [Pyrinomonadaceae bacterium]|nr:GAF domain-containing protein [Pyrinomonadaceae bacterium]